MDKLSSVPLANRMDPSRKPSYPNDPIYTNIKQTQVNITTAIDDFLSRPESFKCKTTKHFRNKYSKSTVSKNKTSLKPKIRLNVCSN